jgi:Holliday junction resolvase-like predicted endonuclease
MVSDISHDPGDEVQAALEAIVACVLRDDGNKTHVFLDYSNRCACGEVDLNVYKDLVLR